MNGVSLGVDEGGTVALIGESGSGKSTVGRLALGLQRPDRGRVLLEGRDLSTLRHRELQGLRGRMSVVFQEPYESLNPLMTVGQIVEEPLLVHNRDLSREQRRARVVETLELVALGAGVPAARPSALSGGQQQRVGIARAIVTRPRFVVLDEPTSSLDLSVRAQILRLLRRLQGELGLAYLFISHDIQTVAYIADRVAVMYLGSILEVGPTAEVLERPRHPYTVALLAATLSADPKERRPPLPVRGEPPSATVLPEGCAFHARCPYASDPRCARERPPLRPVGDGHEVATFYDL